jgi:predicted CoA-binding protein
VLAIGEQIAVNVGHALGKQQQQGGGSQAAVSFGSKLAAKPPKSRFAARGSPMADLEPIPYPDQQIRRILETVKTIAMVGASSNWNRPSYFVMKYLQGKGYRVIPVNPGIAGQQLLGETVYASLRDIPEKIDMVDVFRAARDTPKIIEDAIAIGAPVVWMQLGIRNDERRRWPSRPASRSS